MTSSDFEANAYDIGTTSVELLRAEAASRLKRAEDELGRGTR